jgi:hypothetical protein
VGASAGGTDEETIIVITLLSKDRETIAMFLKLAKKLRVKLAAQGRRHVQSPASGRPAAPGALGGNRDRAPPLQSIGPGLFTAAVTVGKNLSQFVSFGFYCILPKSLMQ